jgi:GNAT superfamily N-acetyltransferase
MTTGIELALVVVPRSGAAWSLDTVRSSDGPALVSLFNRCSPETVYRRFFGRPTVLPPAYLAAVLAERPHLHDAVIVRCHGGRHVAGLASLAMDGESATHAELAVLVADAWQRQGLGAAMVDALLERARARGIERLSAAVLPGRAALLSALGRRLALQRLTPSTDTITGTYMLRRSPGDPLRADDELRRY